MDWGRTQLRMQVIVNSFYRTKPDRKIFLCYIDRYKSLFITTDIDCAKVLPVLNGAVEYVNGTTHLGSEITYGCTKNYRLNGVSRRYCLDNGQWSDATPKCEGKIFND